MEITYKQLYTFWLACQKLGHRWTEAFEHVPEELDFDGILITKEYKNEMRSFRRERLFAPRNDSLTWEGVSKYVETYLGDDFQAVRPKHYAGHLTHTTGTGRLQLSVDSNGECIISIHRVRYAPPVFIMRRMGFGRSLADCQFCFPWYEESRSFEIKARHLEALAQVMYIPEPIATVSEFLKVLERIEFYGITVPKELGDQMLYELTKLPYYQPNVDKIIGDKE